jgi:ERCC4-type nuclease
VTFTILVDSHEPADADPILRGLGCATERRSLGPVDYAVWDGDVLLVLAERKTHRDLVLSLLQRPSRGTNGQRRLWTQLDRLEAIPGEAAVLLYERHSGRDPYPNLFPNALGALVSIQRRGLLVLPTRDLHESLRALVTVARRMQRERKAPEGRAP